MTALDRLRTIAEQACAGPWEALGGYPQHVMGYSPDPPSEDTRRVEVCTVHNAPESGAPDAVYIAAFDPTVVLALLDVAEAAADAPTECVDWTWTNHDNGTRTASDCGDCWACRNRAALGQLREVTS